MMQAVSRRLVALHKNLIFFRVVSPQHRLLHIMKLNNCLMDSVLSPKVKQFSELFSKHGYEIRIAGGAVRDLLMGKIPHDLDFATTATPEEMKKMFESEGVRMLNLAEEKYGKHGTVTARFEEENFECTTLRIDVNTYGHHAEVESTTDWQLDALRRDLTINSMFLSLDGTIHDYFDGSKHLKEKIVVFVGDADKRIKEDYLRILRYFRFYGRIADVPDSHNFEVVDSIKRNVEGLGKIAGERIWVEMQKIVTGNFGGELIVKMVECGVGPYVGLPENFDCDSIRRVYKRCEESGVSTADMQPMTLLAAGFSTEEEVKAFVARIKCSKREREMLFFIMDHRDIALTADSFKDIQDLIVDTVIGEKRNKDVALLFVSELLKYACKVDYLNQLNAWEIPRFPVNGNMVAAKGVPRKKIKYAMQDLICEWKRSGFSMTGDELLNNLDLSLYSNESS